MTVFGARPFARRSSRNAIHVRNADQVNATIAQRGHYVIVKMHLPACINGPGGDDLRAATQRGRLNTIGNTRHGEVL